MCIEGRLYCSYETKKPFSCAFGKKPFTSDLISHILTGAQENAFRSGQSLTNIWAMLTFDPLYVTALNVIH